jgi:Ca-activated chloride channel family protein
MVDRGPGVDEGLLREIASQTGGAYWLAESSDELTDIIGEVDRLEKSGVESIRYLGQEELFGPWALAALGVLCLEQLLGSTWWRRIP